MTPSAPSGLTVRPLPRLAVHWADGTVREWPGQGTPGQLKRPGRDASSVGFNFQSKPSDRAGATAVCGYRPCGWHRARRWSSWTADRTAESARTRWRLAPIGSPPHGGAQCPNPVSNSALVPQHRKSLHSTNRVCHHNRNRLILSRNAQINCKRMDIYNIHTYM